MGKCKHVQACIGGVCLVYGKTTCKRVHACTYAIVVHKHGTVGGLENWTYMYKYVKSA